MYIQTEVCPYCIKCTHVVSILFQYLFRLFCALELEKGFSHLNGFGNSDLCIGRIKIMKLVGVCGPAVMAVVGDQNSVQLGAS